MNADALKKLTTESLNQLAAMLDQGHSERLTSAVDRPSDKTAALEHRGPTYARVGKEFSASSQAQVENRSSEHGQAQHDLGHGR